MASFLFLFICLLLGAGFARFSRPPEGLSKHLNWWVLHIAFPAVVLEKIPQLHFDTSLWFLAVGLWLMFAGSWWLFHVIGTRLHWSRGTIGAVVLTAGLSNSAYVGLPLIEALRGKDALSYATLADQLGSFLMLTVGGTVVATLYAGGKIDHRSIVRKIIFFPPFIALLVAILVTLTPGWPVAFETALQKFGATMTPVALFSVGLQLRFRLSAQRVLPFCLGLGWKLALGPLLVFALGRALQISPPVLMITLLQTAMPPMVTAAILAEQGNLDPPLANMMVGLGIFVAFISVPLWNLLG